MPLWDRIGNARAFDIAGGARTASTASTGSTPVALPALGADRIVRIHASAALWINFGLGSGGGAAAATVAGTSLPISAGQSLEVVIPAGATHFAVIRDSADGFGTLHAVR